MGPECHVVSVRLFCCLSRLYIVLKQVITNFFHCRVCISLTHRALKPSKFLMEVNFLVVAELYN